MAKSLGDIVGGWAFLIGVVLALIVGLMNLNTPTMLTALVVIGIIVGLLNVADKEVMPFLLSGLVLVLISDAGITAMAKIPFVNSIFNALLAIFIPATVIVAVKNVMSLAKK